MPQKTDAAVASVQGHYSDYGPLSGIFERPLEFLTMLLVVTLSTAAYHYTYTAI